jgi:hypothetical protein
MEKTVPELIAAISPEEWAQVPVSVLCLGLFHEREIRSERLRKLIEELVRRMDKIEQEMAELRTENELLKEQLVLSGSNRVTIEKRTGGGKKDSAPTECRAN